MVNMKFPNLIIIQLSVIIIKLSSCQDCCKRYVVITKPSLDQVSTIHSNNCDLTLNELFNYYGENKIVDANCSSKEILFQSGTHIINKNRSLSFENSSKINLETVVISGEQFSTIECVNDGQLYFTFRNIYINGHD